MSCQEAIWRYFPKDQWPNAIRIMQAESGGRTSATGYNRNGTVDRGCMQVNSIHAWRVNGNLTSLYDPLTNARVAYDIWRERGWCAWSTAPKLGLCR